MKGLLLLLLALPAAARDCVPAGSVPDLLEQAEAMTPVQRRGLDVAGFLTPAVYDAACRGLAAGSPKACAEFAGLTLRIPGARSLEWNCLQRYDEAAFTRALIKRDPRAAAVCVAFVRGQFGIADAGKARALCADVISGGKAADDALCREVFAASGREATDLRLKGCLGALAIYRGERTDCEALAGQDYLASDLALCRAVRAYRKAEAGGGPAACGDEPLCRVLAGAGPAACAPYAAKARAVFAARRSGAGDSPAAPGPTGAPVLSLVDDVQPQVPEFQAPRPATAAAPGGASAVGRRDAYPSFEGGVLRPPKLYGAVSEDLEPALRAAHRYFDANAAYQDGYRPAPPAGLEARLIDPDARPGRPRWLGYVVDAQGRWQLVRLGWPRGSDISPAAPSVYNSAGLFAAEFPDEARLAADGARTFYGAPAGRARRRRPVCRP